MAYDEDLANRIRELVLTENGVTEQRMFGGLGFMIDGNLSVSASSQGGLLVRTDPAETDALMNERHAAPFEMRGRGMRGWLRVDAEGCGPGTSSRGGLTAALPTRGRCRASASPSDALTDSTWPTPTPRGTAPAPLGSPSWRDPYLRLRLAFVAALQYLPPRQRAVLILCEVLHWKASEAAELLETSVASVNSALQRARATLEASDIRATDPAPSLDAGARDLLSRYVEAFELYDMDALTSLIHEDAKQSMPPYDLWLGGRRDILHWWVGPGAECRGSRVVPTVSANGSAAFGQYKPAGAGAGYHPWALQVLEVDQDQIVEFTFFLATKTLFPLFGLPARLDN